MTNEASTITTITSADSEDLGSYTSGSHHTGWNWDAFGDVYTDETNTLDAGVTIS